MSRELHPGPTQIVIFGGGGDLARRKLIPALYNLSLDGWLPEQLRIFGLDLKKTDTESFREDLRDGVGKFSRRGVADGESWKRFAEHISYFQADFGEAGAYSRLADVLDAGEKEWDVRSDRIFYQATPPSLVASIIRRLGESGLAAQQGRIVLEKPFGTDLESARSLNRMLTGVFPEESIYRIDHYLGKETVQNILAFRFANVLFEPIWNRNFIDHVQVTVAENVGVEHRGAYYDDAGALRDMIQNHLLQVLCLIAMEPPVSFDADEVRNKKVDVLHATRIASVEKVVAAVRGQYDEGSIDNRKVPGYRSEPGVAADSTTETFAALKMYVDNWRWQGVPFYLRTGKRLPAKVSEALIQFRPVPHQSFPSSALESWQPNRLSIHIQPDEGITLRCEAKTPGPKMRLATVGMRFTYREAFKQEQPAAYETLLLDVILGDATLFMRADQVEAAWSVVSPVLEAWQSAPEQDFPNYAAGSWGPESAESLISRDGRIWYQPLALKAERPRSG